jgi:PAS domain S-box-containing protein
MLRVFFVEDESKATPGLREGLTRTGYNVVGSASSSEEALREIERTRPDLVLIDVALDGGLKGVAAAEVIQDRFGISVLFLLSDADRERLQHANITLPFSYILRPSLEPETPSAAEDGQPVDREKDIPESERRYREQFENAIRTQMLLAERERVATFAANVGVALTHGTTLRGRLEKCAEAMIRDLGAGIVSIWTATPEGTLTIQAALGSQEKIPSPRTDIPIGQYRIGAIARDETPMLLNLVTAAPGDQDRQWARDAGMVAFAGYPLLCNQRLMGVMALFTEKPLTRATLVAMASVADGIALAIDRVRTDEALRESEERYRDLVENSEDLIYTHTPDGTILSVNQAMTRKIGASDPKDLAGRSVLDYIVPRHRDEYRLYLDEVRKQGQAKGLWHARMLNGEERVFEYAVTLRKEGLSLPIVRGRAIDVTERIAAERALRASEKRFRILVENSLGFICTHDLEGAILAANPAAAASLGYTQEEMTGKNLTDLVSPGYAPRIAEYLKRIALEGVVSGQMVTLTRDGAERIWEYRNCLYEESKEKRYVIGYAQDITERKRIEQAKEEIVSIVAHELRSPITSIRGSLEYLAKRMPEALPVKAQKLIGMAFRGTERLVRLINDLLDIDKIESGKMEFDMKAQEISPLVQQAIESMQAYADQYKATLVMTQPLPQATATVDADRFIQVMTNLLSNASKFSLAGQSVEVALTSRDDSVQISVRDHGPGIPEMFRNDVFKKFSQADMQKGGSGLGLNISKVIVEKLGGTISFETGSSGTTFYVDLPKAH